MLWQPEKIWDGCEVFVVGGGTSLEHFDFELIKSEKIIGCNDWYKVGPEICNICFFGDQKWLKVHEKYLVDYVKAGGIVVTNDRHLKGSRIPWLMWMPRERRGLHTNALGWCGNSGNAAINLALILGAKIVYLLGFDRFKGHKGLMNPKRYRLRALDMPDSPRNPLFSRWHASEGYAKKDLANKFPNCQVINVSDNTKLKHWPIVSLKEFFERRKNGRLNNTVK